MTMLNSLPISAYNEEFCRDYTYLFDFEHDWEALVCRKVSENMPMATPTPLGKYVTISHYVYANFYHDLISGLSVTRTLHVLNQTPINWFLKKQTTVETATHGP